MFQLYLKGCDDAIALYQKAFGATIEAIYRNPDNTIAHAEIKAFGQCIAFIKTDAERIAGNTMQFCFHFGEGYEDIVKQAYEVLKDGAQIDVPLGPCEYSPSYSALWINSA